MIKIGIPFVNRASEVLQCLRFLSDNSEIPQSIHMVLIDNASDPWPIQLESEIISQGWSFTVSLRRNHFNTGYYFPLTQVAEGTTNADIIGLMHDDLFIYEKGWDRRLLDSFLHNSRLGMVGVCGSDDIDDRGGRGGGTMCNFDGRAGQLQEHTGKRITGLHQALILDSMFMAMRRPVMDALCIDEHIAPCHFYDKIWPLRAIERGWDVAVLGLSVDHQGGLTSTGSRFEDDCARWCRLENLSFEPGKANLAVYLEAERRFLTEYRAKGYIPHRIVNPWHN